MKKIVVILLTLGLVAASVLALAWTLKGSTQVLSCYDPDHDPADPDAEAYINSTTYYTKMTGVRSSQKDVCHDANILAEDRCWTSASNQTFLQYWWVSCPNGCLADKCQ